jgi:hypothetical protein
MYTSSDDGVGDAAGGMSGQSWETNLYNQCVVLRSLRVWPFDRWL